MRKKSEFTIVERALQTVEGFSLVFKTLQQQVTIRGQRQSTLNNYIRRIALICLEFNRLPEDISQDEINEYLTALALSRKSPSRTVLNMLFMALGIIFAILVLTNVLLLFLRLKEIHVFR